MGLGNVREAQGDYEKALFHYGKAQEVYVAVYGDMHHVVADTKYNTAAVFESQGKPGEARKLFLESAKIYAAVLGDDHATTVDARGRAKAVGGEHVVEEGEDAVGEEVECQEEKE